MKMQNYSGTIIIIIIMKKEDCNSLTQYPTIKVFIPVKNQKKKLYFLL